MVNFSRYILTVLFCLSLLSGRAHGNEIISQSISADACDDRMVDDDGQTAENRAVDKAGLSAIKLSGIIQRHDPDLSANAIDTIAYRIIDEYMVNAGHTIKFSDSSRVCVKLVANVEMTSDDLDKLIEEYKDSDAPAEQIAEVVKQVEEDTSFKPQSLGETRLLYIDKMIFWNGNETEHYADFLTGLFSNSEYFYVTKNKKIADFVITPRLTRSEVEELDRKNKMLMTVELEASMQNDKSFAPLIEQENHFITFARNEDEQKIADELLRKLLAKIAKEMNRKIDKYSASYLERKKIRGN